MLAAGGAFAAPITDAEQAALGRARAVDNTTPEQRRAVEHVSLASGGTGARRDGDGLTLRLQGGAERVFRDKPECRSVEQEAHCQTFIFIAHLGSQHLFVVEQSFYEGADYLLIDDRSGQQISIAGFPFFSPTGRYILQITPDNNGDDPLVVWRRQGDRFVRDWSGSLAPFGVDPDYELDAWPTDDSLRLHGLASPGSSHQVAVSLRRTGAGWLLSKDP
jgi:hypothetical protein